MLKAYKTLLDKGWSSSPFLFVDFDGVLNTNKEAVNEDFRKECVENLNKIILNVPDLRIIISSSWKIGRTLLQLRELLAGAGMVQPHIVVDKTPDLYYISQEYLYVDSAYPDMENVRAAEIACSVNTKNIIWYLAIDDNPDKHMEAYTIRTTMKDGLTALHAETVVERFREMML